MIKAVDLPLDRAGLIQDVYKYEKYLRSINCCTVSKNRKPKSVQWFSKFDRKIFLYHTEKDGQGHFDVITKVNGMMCKQYYCTQCEKSFKSRTQHKCKSWCNICGRSSCNIQQEVICTDCNRKCRSQDCLKAHKQRKTGRGKNKGKTLPSFCQQFSDAMNVELQFKGIRETPYYMNVVK